MAINLEQLITSMKNTRTNITFVVNKDTGEIINKEDIKAHDGAEYIEIPSMDVRGLMEDYANDFEGEINEKLKKALAGRDNFRRFNDTLRELNLLSEYNRYRDYAYEDDAKTFMKEHDLTYVDEGVRPYIICHMLTSIDGKVTGEFLNDEASKEALKYYYEIHRNTRSEGFACGKITMNESFVLDNEVDLSKYNDVLVDNSDFIADEFAKFYAVSFDSKGSLLWKDAYIKDEDPGYNGAHVIEVIGPKTSSNFKAYCKDKGISYIEADNFKEALVKLYRKFGIRRLLLEGGSELDETFFKEDVVDELSLVISPVIAGGSGKDLNVDSNIRKFKCMNHRRLNDDVIYGRYVKA